MTGIDACFLIDLYWEDSPRHADAVKTLRAFSHNPTDELLVYHNVFNEFVHTITDTRRFENALSMKDALDIVDLWCDMEQVRVVYPSDSSFKRAVTWHKLYGLGRKRLNDTAMAACYAVEGASSILTANPKVFEIFETFRLINYAKL